MWFLLLLRLIVWVAIIIPGGIYPPPLSNTESRTWNVCYPKDKCYAVESASKVYREDMHGFGVVTQNNKLLSFAADTSEERDNWLDSRMWSDGTFLTPTPTKQRKQIKLQMIKTYSALYG